MGAVTLTHRLSAAERETMARDGYVVRAGVFSPAECARLAGDCEALVAELEAAKQGPKHKVGSYMFEMRRHISTVVKWEPFAPDLVQGVEFFLHLSPALAAWAVDERLLAVMRDFIGEDDIIPFTEKLNLKRKRQGGAYILHQDLAYWRQVTGHADKLATAMICLDDATVENGCLQVAPGSHRDGLQPMQQVDGFGAMEMDQTAYDGARLAPVEAKSGSVIFFGPLLVHRSFPNTSDQDRRALLLSYQPAGHPHSKDLTRPASIRALT